MVAGVMSTGLLGLLEKKETFLVRNPWPMMDVLLEANACVEDEGHRWFGLAVIGIQLFDSGIMMIAGRRRRDRAPPYIFMIDYGDTLMFKLF
ncbi:unnamed protein product [Lactuca virosa]|uniref:Uncharacterized protein n=1 Tax=Lactuca virosa TaxID=75947 RepID=A0AAU9PHH1_9ASTR|nr:unnamed protein product [Lactuca virosa]